MDVYVPLPLRRYIVSKTSSLEQGIYNLPQIPEKMEHLAIEYALHSWAYADGYYRFVWELKPKSPFGDLK